jgi:hypothetical protein
MVNKAHNLPPYTFGVEIETFGVHGAVLAWGLRNAGLHVVGTFAEDGGNGQTRRTAREQGAWDLGEDGSIRGKNPIEIRSPILSGIKGLKEIEKVCRVLKQVGSEINTTCGLHVHIGILNASQQGIKPFTAQEVLTIVKRYQTWEKSIDSFLASGRRDDKNEYCRSTGRLVGVLQPEIDRALAGGVTGPTLADAEWARVNTMSIRGCDCANCVEQALVVENRRREDQFRRNTGRRIDLAKPETLAAFGEHYDRVSVQPLNKYGTIEFRQHHGTINAKEITNWIRFLINHIEVSRRICAAAPVVSTAIAPASAAPETVKQKPVKDRDVLMGLSTSTRKHFKGQASRFAPRPRRPRTAAPAAVPAPAPIDAPIGHVGVEGVMIRPSASAVAQEVAAGAPRRLTFRSQVQATASVVNQFGLDIADELDQLIVADLEAMGPAIPSAPYMAPPVMFEPLDPPGTPRWTVQQQNVPVNPAPPPAPRVPGPQRPGTPTVAQARPNYWTDINQFVSIVSGPGTWGATYEPAQPAGGGSIRYEPTTTVTLHRTPPVPPRPRDIDEPGTYIDEYSTYDNNDDSGENR